MLQIDTLDKAFAYSVGRLNLETGEIGGEEVEHQLEEMKKYCRTYGEYGERKQETCPNYINCRYHPIPSYCDMRMREELTKTIKTLLGENK